MTNAGKMMEAALKHTPLPWKKVDGTFLGFEGGEGFVPIDDTAPFGDSDAQPNEDRAALQPLKKEVE